MTNRLTIDAKAHRLCLSAPACAHRALLLQCGTVALINWAGSLRQAKVETAHIYFDNDQVAYAVCDALEFKEMLA